jgi:hypothetical protein
MRSLLFGRADCCCRRAVNRDRSRRPSQAGLPLPTNRFLPGLAWHQVVDRSWLSHSERSCRRTESRLPAEAQCRRCARHPRPPPSGGALTQVRASRRRKSCPKTRGQGDVYWSDTPEFLEKNTFARCILLRDDRRPRRRAGLGLEGDPVTAALGAHTRFTGRRWRM